MGLGKLGSSLAACIAARGYRVTGVDVDAKTVDAINNGLPPVNEPGLVEILGRTESRLRATSDSAKAVAESDVTFVVVPTPSAPDGTFSNKYVIKACEEIALGLARKKSFHLIVLVSTVMPGSTGGEIQLALEKFSGKSCSVDFGLCYGPAFVALGSVVRDFLNPDYLLIGESDTRSGDILENLYEKVCETVPPVARMSFINAELTKLANNTFVSTKITFGNMLSQICERLPGAHVDVVTSALGLDSRIGEKFLKGGLGYGGPCLVRDNIALSVLANQIGACAQLSEATDQANRMGLQRLIDLIKSKRTESGAVGVLGLSYKPDTEVVEESQGLILAGALANEGIPVVAYDPSAMDQAKRSLPDAVEFAESLEDCIKQSQVVVITTPWRQFQTIKPGLFNPPGSKVLIDCWRIVDGDRLKSVAEHMMLGVGHVPSMSALTAPSIAKPKMVGEVV